MQSQMGKTVPGICDLHMSEIYGCCLPDTLLAGVQMSDSARQLLAVCEKNPSDAVQLNYDARNPFDLCSITFTPIYRYDLLQASHVIHCNCDKKLVSLFHAYVWQ